MHDSKLPLEVFSPDILSVYEATAASKECQEIVLCFDLITDWEQTHDDRCTTVSRVRVACAANLVDVFFGPT